MHPPDPHDPAPPPAGPPATDPAAGRREADDAEVRRMLAAVVIARIGINAGQRVVFPFLPAIARGLDTSLSTIANLTALASLVGVLAPLASALSARVGRRAVMLGSLVAALAGTAVVGLSTTVVVAAVGFVLIGAGKPGFDVPMQAWFGDRVPYARRGRVLGATELTWAGGLLASVPLSGWLIARTSWRAPFAVVAVLLVIGVVAVQTLMVADRPTRAAASAGPRPRSRTRVTRPQVAVLLVVMLFTFAAMGLFVVYGAWLEADLGLDVTAIGLFTLVVVAAELTGEGAVTAVGDRVGLRRSVLCALGLSVVAYAALGLVGSSLPAALVAVVAWFIGYEVTIVAAVPLVTELAGPAEDRDRLMGLMVSVVSVARALGAVAMPLVFLAGGIQAAGLVAAGCVAVAAAVLITAVPDPAR